MTKVYILKTSFSRRDEKKTSSQNRFPQNELGRARTHRVVVYSRKINTRQKTKHHHIYHSCRYYYLYERAGLTNERAR
jgi:hypothetical protein